MYIFSWKKLIKFWSIFVMQLRRSRFFFSHVVFYLTMEWPPRDSIHNMYTGLITFKIHTTFYTTYVGLESYFMHCLSLKEKLKNIFLLDIDWSKYNICILHPRASMPTKSSMTSSRLFVRVLESALEEQVDFRWRSLSTHFNKTESV